MSVEEEIEWLLQVKCGGKEFILSLKDSHTHLESFSLRLFIFKSSVLDFQSQVHMSLEGAATSVNMTRKVNNLPEIEFSRLRELLAYEVRKLELATASRWSSRRSQAGARDSVTIETPAISRLESRSHVCMYNTLVTVGLSPGI